MCRDDAPAPPASLRRVQCRARAEDAIQSHMRICSKSPGLVFRDARPQGALSGQGQTYTKTRASAGAGVKVRSSPPASRTEYAA